MGWSGKEWRERGRRKKGSGQCKRPTAEVSHSLRMPPHHRCRVKVGVANLSGSYIVYMTWESRTKSTTTIVQYSLHARWIPQPVAEVAVTSSFKCCTPHQSLSQHLYRLHYLE